MSKQPKHQILSGSNVAQFVSYMTKGSKVFGNNPASASISTTNYEVSASVVVPFNSNPLELQLKAAGSSSKDISQIIGLIDIRLNPQLYRKYQLNYALASGSTYNEAVMWSVNNS